MLIFYFFTLYLQLALWLSGILAGDQVSIPTEGDIFLALVSYCFFFFFVFFFCFLFFFFFSKKKKKKIL